VDQQNTMYGKPSSESVVEEMKQQIEGEKHSQFEIEKHIADFQKKI